MAPGRRFLGVVTRPFRMLLLAFAAAFGAAPRQHFRHEDSVVQVAGDDSRRD
jgi:hypothetical protein